MNKKMISVLEMSIRDVNAEYIGLDRLLLMENAGRSLADLCLKEYYKNNLTSPIYIFCGRGGNGGDGMVAARHLIGKVPVKLFLLGSKDKISSSITNKNWKILEKIFENIEITELLTEKDIRDLQIIEKSLIIDAILGTGIHGKIREPLNTLISKINEFKEKKSLIVSVDTPTGIDPDTGKSAGNNIKPTMTCVFHKAKRGLTEENSGKIIVKSIGIFPWIEKIVGPGHYLAVKKKQEWSHKGDNGHVLIIGGSKDYSGAPAFSAIASLRAGSDLATILTSDVVSQSIRSFSPEIIVKEYNGSYLYQEVIEKLDISGFNTLVIGPGIGNKPETKEAVTKLLDLCKKNKLPVVVDADALKMVDANNFTEQTILTPHGGEFQIMTGVKLPSKPNEFQERLNMVKKATSQYKGVWVVKGHWDIITNGNQSQINLSGIPEMTIGGTGDILTGIIASFSNRTKNLFYTSCLGCYINGKAGERSKNNFTIENLLSEIPLAIKDASEFIDKTKVKRN